jgi:Tol biopolymer transport system component
MKPEPGSRLGPYEILSSVGAGGMGEVWRARDTRLGREVAVKVLPARLAGDPEALARFEREARAVASLSHPNILAIHDFGREGDVVYSVTEMVEGETLRVRLAGGALPVRKALDYAQQIARGLAAAQDRWVVHRDLKPENLIITPEGSVKILDFGLAKVASADRDGLTSSPTVEGGTLPGTVMGTMGYMSPEQVRGHAVDHRTDIFAFGAVLYEMLTGRAAFRRDTAADTVSAILREEPGEMSATHRAISPGLERIVHHCLEKNPAERFQSARDLAFHLEAMSGSASGLAAGLDSGALPAVAVRGARRSGIFGLGLGFGLLAGVAAGWVGATWWSRPVTYSPPSLRTLTYSGADREPAASPDGRLIAYASKRESGASRIWLKQLPGGDEVELTRGPDDSLPRISPDGSQVLFVRRDGALLTIYKIAVVGGDPRKVIDDADSADWSPDGSRIAFVRSLTEGSESIATLMVVDAAGDDARELARVKHLDLDTPRWSPDGRTIALAQTGTENAASTFLLVDVEDGTIRSLSPPPPLGRLSAPVWAGSGRTLLYAKSETQITGQTSVSPSRVMVQDIDSGEARILMWVPSASETLDIVGSGSIVLGTGSLRQNLREVSLDGDTSPSSTGRWLTRGNSMDRQPVFSSDGRWLLFSSNRTGNLDLWKMSTETGAIRRITEDTADDWDPAFTRDGRNILWSSNRSGHFEIWMCAADGTSARQLSRDGFDAENPTQTPDGWIVYNSGNPAHSGIWKMRADGSEATRLVPGSWSTPDVSPDGQHVAFRTASQPRTLHVARVSDGSPVIPPIVLPGTPFTARPRWMPDGGALLYIGSNAEDRRGIFVQPFQPGKDSTALRRPLAGFEAENFPETLGISPDGKRLVFSMAETQESLILAEGLDGVVPPPRGRPTSP